MIGSDVGPFRIVRELGQGGMGTVYLAEVTGRAPGLERDDRVALKVVHPHLLSTPGFFKRFLREAELGKQVRHENVVRTIDVDAMLVGDRQVNYLVMEYVEGRSLRDLLKDLGTVPENLLREIALQATAGLAAIHEAGIVHRDLKPENLLITDDDEIRIMDLGVAKLQEASVALTQEGQFAGSFLYAAPEQFKGRGVSATADLYSLGVILHELATGANPFQHDEPSAVIHAHLHTEPPRARDRSPDVSDFFSEVAGTLLAKEPEGRFENASVLQALLTEGESSSWWTDRRRQLGRDEARLPNIRVRRETGLIGRDEELGVIREAWERAKAGHGGTILLEGEAGIGKSRLVDAFLREIGGNGTHILYGSYPPSGGLGGLSDAILGAFDEADLEHALAPYLTVTPSLVPAFAALIRHEAPPAGADTLQGDSLQAVACHLLRALAAEEPTVWIVDDLHFAPEDSRNLVLSLARAAAGHRALLLITARSGLPEDDVTNLSRLEDFRRIPLGRLGAREIVKLLADAFKSESLATKLGGTIGYKSDGVPFFIFEMIRALKEGSLLEKRPDGTFVQTQVISEIEVPSAVKDLIEARLRDLTKEERAILDVGAVMGFTFEPDLVARVRETKRIRVLETLADLERRSGIVHGEAGACRFDQYQIQEVLLSGLMPDLRAEYHSMLAEALADREGLDDLEPDEIPDDDALFLATHHLQGSTPRAALKYLGGALKHLREAHRNDAAVDLANRALGVKKLLRGRKRFDLLLSRNSLLELLGRSAERISTLEEAIAIADDLSDPALRGKAICALGNLHARRGDQAKARETLLEAMELARAADDPKTEQSCSTGLGVVAWYLGNYEELIERFEALRVSDPESLPGTGNTGVGYWDTGRYEEALTRCRRARDLARSQGNRMWEVITGVNVGAITRELGDVDRAREFLEDSRRLSREVGDRRNEAYALHRLGDLTAQQGDVREAERLYRGALEVRREIHYRSGEAETLAALGRLREDEAILEEALALGREIHLPGVIVLATAGLALLPGGTADDAVRTYEELETRLRHRDKMEVRLLLFRLTDDGRHLDEAHRLLDDMIEHAPEEYRESMVANVPLHRDIAAAWAEHRS